MSLDGGLRSGGRTIIGLEERKSAPPPAFPGTVFSERDYAKVRQLGGEHTTQTPRRIAR
jgi:hypothetical protein